MLDSKLFEDKVLKPCQPPALQPLLQRLRQLFFPFDGSRYSYCSVVDPEEFLLICRSELETLSRPAKPSSSQHAPRAEAGLMVVERQIE